MKRDDAEEFTQSLGQIVGGSWRQIALAKRLGVPQVLGLSVDAWVNQRLGGYIRMSVEDRRKAVDELKAEGASNREISSVLGVSDQTVNNDVNAKKLASVGADTEGADDADANVLAPLDTVAALALTERAVRAGERKEATEARERRDLNNLTRPVETALAGLHRGDFRELAREIASESVELVFTDPPYDRDSLPLYEDAAREAARILKPGGSMACYVGQILLPDALSALSRHLRYWWTGACVHSGGNQMMNKYGVRCGWKPLMWFVKGSRGDVSNVVLDTISGGREKDAHEWQQAESEAAYFIEKLCSPAGTVVDFFAGAGTTCVAAERLGRQWVAFEVDARHYDSACRRILELREAA